MSQIQSDTDEAILAAVKRILLGDLSASEKCLAVKSILPVEWVIEPIALTAVQAARNLQWKVWEKTGGCCTYCAVKLNPFDRNARNGFHIDHSVPRAQGGSDDLANLAPACSRCNFAKYARTPDEWEAANA